MTKYREIIRLTGLGFSQRDIMASCGVAQKTVVKVQKRARELKLSLFFATPKYLKMQNAFPKVAAGNSSFLHVSPA